MHVLQSNKSSLAILKPSLPCPSGSAADSDRSTALNSINNSPVWFTANAFVVRPLALVSQYHSNRFEASQDNDSLVVHCPSPLQTSKTWKSVLLNCLLNGCRQHIVVVVVEWWQFSTQETFGPEHREQRDKVESPSQIARWPESEEGKHPFHGDTITVYEKRMRQRTIWTCFPNT